MEASKNIMQFTKLFQIIVKTGKSQNKNAMLNEWTQNVIFQGVSIPTALETLESWVVKINVLSQQKPRTRPVVVCQKTLNFVLLMSSWF